MNRSAAMSHRAVQGMWRDRLMLGVTASVFSLGMLSGCSGDSEESVAAADADAVVETADAETQPVLATNTPAMPEAMPDVEASLADAVTDVTDRIPTSRIMIEVFAISVPAGTAASDPRSAALTAELGDFLGASNENVLSETDAVAIRELFGALNQAGLAESIATEQIDAPFGIAAERAMSTRDALGTDLNLLVTPTAVSRSDNEPEGSVRVAYTMTPVAQEVTLTTRMATFDPGPVTSVARRAVAAPGETVYTARSIADAGIDVLVLMTFE